jgi:carboxylesterase
MPPAASATSRHPVQAGAEPFASDGGPTGVLVCHGFTGSPRTVRPWAEYLAAAGFTVRAPLLPGHGTTWQDLARTSWRDWYAEAERAFAELDAKCERIFLAGISMGGCLALRIAETKGRPQDSKIGGVVLVNPSLAPDTKLFLLAPVLKHVLPSLRGIAGDIKKPGASEGGYDRIPVRAAATLPDMWRTTVAQLRDVRQPVLVFRSAVDHVVGPASMKALAEALPDAEIRPLPDSFHVATLDHDAPAIFEGTVTFIKEHGCKD